MPNSVAPNPVTPNLILPTVTPGPVLPASLLHPDNLVERILAWNKLELLVTQGIYF